MEAAALVAILILVFVSPALSQTTYDYGDAPDGTGFFSRYPTLLSNSGARHIIDPTKPHLGATAPDAESDGQPDPTAAGDGTDEDGVTFTTALIVGEQATLEVVMTLGSDPTVTTAYLDAWIDFETDDDWTGTNEHIVDQQALSQGTTTITFTVPAGATPGTTFARFRLSTDSAGLDPTGDAVDGEVEDYAVEIFEADWGDAPNEDYDTLRVNDGPRHAITGPFMGTSAPDAESNGQESAGADGDDLNGIDDEDGAVIPTLIRGENATMTVIVGGAPGYVDAWIDFSIGNHDFLDAGEKVVSAAPVTVGSNTLGPFSVPATARIGTSYARVRISTDPSGLSPIGLVEDGEVEDSIVTVLGLDFGDAPSSYPVKLASDGARHADTDTPPYLGTVGPDVEDDGQPSAGADGDDVIDDDNDDDEDGVVFTSDLVPGGTATVDVRTTGAAKLDAWIDFNSDGDWNDTGEQIFTSEALIDGLNEDLSFTVPAMPDTVPGTTTVARFRYSTAGGLSPTGVAVDGEVEDLLVDIAPVADLEITKTADHSSVIPGKSRVTYTITVTNNGPNDVTDATVVDAFGDDLVGVIWTCSGSTAGVCGRSGGSGDIDTMLDLADGDAATFTVTAWVVPGAAGVTCGTGRCLSNTAEVDVPAGTYDLSTSNNTATDATPALEPEGDLSIDKDDGLTRISPGDLGHYTIRITNPGPSTATAVTLTDTFPTSKIEGHTTECGGGADPCWECAPAPSLDELEVEIEGEGSPTVSGLEGARSPVVSPDGKHVYVAGSIDDALVVFARDGSTGELTWVERQADNSGSVDGLDGASAVAVSPDGRHVYVTGSDDNALAVFSRNASTGALTFVEFHQDSPSTDGLAGALDVVVSPDGAHVYAAGPGDDAVAVFERTTDPSDTNFGTLSFVETHVDGLGGVGGLAGAAALAFSPDGTNLYVAGPDDNAVAVFSRNTDPSDNDFGKLTFVEFQQDSPSTDGLAGALDVTVSPDGAHVYVAGSVDDAVAAFSRNASDGTLSYLGAVKDGDPGGVDGLDGISGLAVSPDGTLVVVAGPNDDSVAVFRRETVSSDPEFGMVTFIDRLIQEGTSGTAAGTIDGLSGADSVSFSPDGLDLFSTGKTWSKNAALVVMTVSAGAVCPDPASGVGDIDEEIAVPAGSWVEFTAWYRAKAESSGTIHNEASFTIDEPTDFTDGDTGNNDDFDDTDIGLEVDIEIVKVAGITSPVPGESLDYTITVTNHGPQNIDGSLGHIRVTDTFPIYDGSTIQAGFDTLAGITWTCSDGTGGHCFTAEGTGNIDVDVDLGAGGSVTFHASGTLHPSSTGTIENTASCTLPLAYADTDLSNDLGIDSRTVAPVADLGIVKSHFPPIDDFSIDPGDAFYYEIMVHNSGPSMVRGALIQDVLPAELQNSTWTCATSGTHSSCGSPTGAGNVTTTVDLMPGDFAKVTISTEVRPDAEGAVVNSATVSGGDADDPVTADNFDTDVITLNAMADLAITKDDGRSEVVPGREIDYTITVTNRGAGEYRDDVYQARVVDTFPPELKDVSWTCDPSPPIPGDLTFVQLNTLAGRLDGASDVALSPDGSHLYAVAAAGDALVAYSRITDEGPNFGRLSSAPIDVEQRDVSDPDPEAWILTELHGPRSVLVSPDGQHVYVAATDGDAVLVFQRDSAPGSDKFGSVSLVETLVDGIDGVEGLDGAWGLALSPDGEFLYVAGSLDDMIAVFDRNPATGRLTFVEVVIDGTGALDGIDGVRAIAVSPDGDHLYAGGADDNAIAWFTRDTATGTLSFENAYFDDVAGVAGLADIAAIVVSPDGGALYVAGPGDDAVASFSRDDDPESPMYGSIEPLNVITGADVEGLEGVRTLALPRDLSDPLDGGEHLLAGGDPSGKLVVFRRNPSTGALSFQEVLREGQPITPPEMTVHGLVVVSAITSSPDGRHVYTTADLDGAVTVFDRRPPDPAFAFVEADVDGEDDGYGTTVSGLGAARSVTVTGDGVHVLATGYTSDSLVVFHRDPERGTTPDTQGEHLAFVASYENGGPDAAGGTIDGLDGAAQIVTSADGLFVYVSSEIDNAVAVFERNSTTGEMTFLEVERDGVDDPGDGPGNPVDGLSGAVALALSPSGGRHLYVAGRYDASIAVFERNATDGLLSFVEKKTNGFDGVEGLDGVDGVAVSPDGAHVYAVGGIDDAIVAFTRDPSDGTLSFLQVLRDDVDAEGLDQAAGVAVSPDGAHVFVAAINDDALAVFARNTDETSGSFGRLTFVRAITDGSVLDGRTVDGLGGARAVAVGAEGLRIFVGSEHDGALSVFGRVADQASSDFGALTPIETRFDGVDGIDGLAQVYDVAVSLSDNSHVYAAGLGDDAVASFEARSGSSCTPSGIGDIDDEVNIGWGGQITYTIRATLAPWATGTLTNEARVFAPPRTVDPDLTDDPVPQPGDNNYDVDTDTITPQADLVLAKTDFDISTTAGTDLQYTITVENRGPSDAVGAHILDTNIDPSVAGSHFADAQWTCRAIGSGSLRMIEVLRDGETQGSLTIDGLDGASSVAVSGDGGSVYATGLTEDSIAVFDRDPSNGTLTFVTVIRNGDNSGGTPVQGLGGASDIAIIDDGVVESVYVTGQFDDAVAVFTRNPADGSLVFLHALFDGSGAEGLDQAVTVIADEQTVYVGGSNDDAIAVFDRQPNGSLIFLETVDNPSYGLDGIADLVIAPDPDGAGPFGSYLYAAGFNSGQVSVFARDVSGTLTFVEKKGSGTSAHLGGAKALTLDATAERLYVAGALDGSIVVFNRSAIDGTLQLLQEINRTIDGLTGLDGIADLIVSPDGAHLYAAGRSADAVVLFRRNGDDGTLSAVETIHDGIASVDGLDGVTALAAAPDGRQIYTAGMSDDAITVFDRPMDSHCPPAGSGAIDETVSIAAGGRLVLTADTVVAPGTAGSPCPEPLDTGRFCVINEASIQPGPTAVFTDPESANDTAIDADYLGRQADLAITKTDQYSRYDGLGGATAVALDPALGEHLYLAGSGDNAIAAFSRNPVDGTVAYLANVVDDTNGVDGLGGVSGLALSPDGRNLYATGPSDNALAAFSRNPDTGLLSFIEVETNGIGDAVGLLGARAVAVGPGGEYVYVAGAGSNAISVFKRNTDQSSAHFGELDFAGYVADGVDGIVGLVTPSALLVSGDNLYVAAAGSNALFVFLLDTDPESPTWGQPIYLESHVDGVDGIQGLRGAEALTVSPNGETLFVTGLESNAVAVFSRDPGTGLLTPVETVFQGDQQGEPGSEITVDGLLQPRGIAVHDGADLTVAVTGQTDDGAGALALFTWSVAELTLTFRETVIDGQDLGGQVVAGLGGAAGMIAEGDRFYVAADGDDTLSVFTDSSGIALLQSFENGGGGIGPGDPDPAKWVRYTITVTNRGPSRVTGAFVRDVFPDGFEDISWTCSVIPADGDDDHTACEIPGGSGDLDETIDVAVGGQVIFSATGRLRPELTGMLSNTATVEAPEGLIDPEQTNNSATDDDTLLTPIADLEIEKTRLDPPVPGETVTYVVTVTNVGPSVAPTNRVTDVVPEALVDVVWSCMATPAPGLLTSPSTSGPWPLDGAAAAAPASDGTRLYAVGSNPGRLTAFDRDTRTGALNLVQTLTDGIDGLDGLAGAVDVVLSPDDDAVYVAAQTDDALSVFTVDPISGQLSFLELHRDGIGIVNGIGRISALALTPDGRTLFAAGEADNAVAVFRRDPSGNGLTFVAVHQEGFDGIDGLAGVNDVAVSPDGSHLYAAGTLDDAVAVFEIDPSTGELAFVEKVADGDLHETGTVEGIGGASAVAVSADGEMVFVTGETSDALAVFSRDSITGRLTFVERHLDGADGVSGLQGASALVMSRDDDQVYVAGTLSNAIAAFGRTDDGGLRFLESYDSASGTPGLTGVRGLAVSTDAKHLYAAARIDSDIVLLGTMLGSRCSDHGNGDIDDTIDLVPGGTATYTLTGRLIPGATGELVNTATVLPGPTVTDPDPTDNTATTTDNTITPMADLAITKDDDLTEVDAGASLAYRIEVVNNGPSDVHGATVTDFFPFFPDETAGLLQGAVSWTCIATGALRAAETFVDGIDGVDGLDGATFVVAVPDPDGPGGEPGGEHLYVTSGNAAALSIFAVDPGTGASHQIDVIRDGDVLDGVTVDSLAGAAGMALSPDGRFLYVAAETDGALSIFERNGDSGSPDFGRLYFVDAIIDGNPVIGLGGAFDIAISPDGLDLYVVSRTAQSVMVFRRDPSTGLLTYVERKFEGGDDVPLQALQGPRDIVITPDGVHLYVAAQDSDAVTSFRRDAATGRLSFVEVIHNLDFQGSVTVNGLDFVRSLALSPGGRFLYAVSLADDAVVVFERNRDGDSPDFGRLTYVESLRDDTGGADGLDGATAVALGPDGGHLYVAGFNDDAVAVFRRDWTDGRLTPIEVFTDGDPALVNLDGASGLAILPDGSKLLVTAANDAALTIFDRTAEGACSPSGIPGDLGEMSETIDLTAGATATFLVGATVDPGARGTLFNTATVLSPLPDSQPANDTSVDDDTTIRVRTDLGITKDDGVETVIAGLPVTYSIVVTNSGPARAYGATVTDTLPPSLTGCVCTRSDEQPCAIDGTNTLVDTVDLEPESSLTYFIDCLLDPATGVPLTNTASIAAEDPAHDSEPANDQATDSDSVVAVSDLSVAKSNGLDEVIPGTVVTYHVAVENLGPSNLSLGRVTDTFPASMGNILWGCVPTAGASCSAGPNTGALSDLVSIPAGGSLDYTIQGLVDPSVLGTIANTAVAEVLIDDTTPGVSATDPDQSNNVANDIDDLTPVADIGITKTDDTDPVTTGFPLNYTISVSNPTGPSWAHDVVITESLPAGVTPVSTTGCVEDPAGIPTCTIGAVLNGASAEVTVSVTVDEGTLGTITNTASVASLSDDPNPADNTTTENTQVDPWADLSIEKTDAVDPAVAGTELSYSITVTNPGPYDAQNVVVTDSMPAGVTFVSSSGCSEDPAGLPDCSLGDIAAGQSATYTLIVGVDSYTLGTITNDASVACDWFDPDTANNVTSEDTEITAESDLAVTKDDGLPFVVPGWEITYTIVVINDGPSDAPSADVSDTIPPELLDVSWTCVPTGAAFCSDGTGNLLLDSVDIPAGDSVTYSVDCTVDPALDPTDPLTISNTVEVAISGDGTDPDISNNSATDTDPVEATDLLWGDDFESGNTSAWSAVVGEVKASTTVPGAFFGGPAFNTRSWSDE